MSPTRLWLVTGAILGGAPVASIEVVAQTAVPETGASWYFAPPAETPLIASAAAGTDPGWIVDGNLVEFVTTASPAERFTPSPAGNYLAVEVHGEILLVPAEEGIGEVTRIAHSAWRQGGPLYAPDGQQLAFLSDEPNNFGFNLQNYGVPPDLWVRNTPEDDVRLFDRELKSAVDEALRLLRSGRWQHVEQNGSR